ncbi:tape measure protein [Fructilactobacillus florum]|uniref:tape measure protein n=1 Tax=Fructilactobacillus florum TaxID=640331 RepID=UPI0006D11070|nr:tape measure protein [Fructilactobacillus florum]
MAEKNAGFNFDVKVAGLDQLNHISSMINDLQDKIGSITAKLGSLGGEFGNLGSKGKSGLDSIKASTDSIRTANTEVSSSIKSMGSDYSALKGKSESFSKSADASSEFRKNNEPLNELRDKVSKVSQETEKLKQPKTMKLTAEDEASPKISEVRGKVDKLSESGETTKKHFGGLHDVMMGSFLGGAISNGVNQLTGSLTEQAKAGYEDAKAADSFNSKFKNMGLNKEGIDKLGASIKDIKENSNISGGAVTSLEQKFYGLTGNVDKTDKLSKGVGSLADQMRLTGSQADAFAGGLNRIEGSGKVTGQSLARLERTAPGFGNALQKSSGMSKDAFDKLVQSGKMTSSQFNDILESASQSYGKNSKEFDKTADGSMHHLQTAYADARKSLFKPLVSVQSSGLNELSQAMDSPQMQKALEALGKGIGNIATKLAGLMTYLAQHSKDIGSIIGSISTIIGLLAQGIWSVFKSAISAISDAFGDLTGNSKKNT